MEIRPNSNVDSVTRLVHTAGKAPRTIDADADVSTFDNSRALESRLNDVPDVRTDKVEHAKRLIGDPTYPPRETIQRLATLLAMAESDHSVL
jgi:hypothetical protein